MTCNKSFQNTKILKMFNMMLNWNINFKSVFYWLTLQNSEDLIYTMAEALKSRAGDLAYRRILLFRKMTATALLKYIRLKVMLVVLRPHPQHYPWFARSYKCHSLWKYCCGYLHPRSVLAMLFPTTTESHSSVILDNY